MKAVKNVTEVTNVNYELRMQNDELCRTKYRV